MGWISKLFFQEDDEGGFKEAKTSDESNLKSDTCVDIWKRRGKTIRDFIGSDELADQLVSAIKNDPYLSHRLTLFVHETDDYEESIRSDLNAFRCMQIYDCAIKEVLDRLRCFGCEESDCCAIVSAITRWAQSKHTWKDK